MIPPVHNTLTSVTVQREFAATRERVFRAWTEQEALQRWFRPMGVEVIVSRLDVRVGGSFRFDYMDGGQAVVGTYLEIVRPEKLVFTWSSVATSDEETLVTISFIEHGSTTQVVLTHERLRNKAACVRHQAGWQGALDRLAESLS